MISNYYPGHFKSFHHPNSVQILEIQRNLLEFYDQDGRELPWRLKGKNSEKVDSEKVQERAYRVWVSEIMLQQTRVETVKEYYQR